MCHRKIMNSLLKNHGFAFGGWGVDTMLAYILRPPEIPGSLTAFDDVALVALSDQLSIQLGSLMYRLPTDKPEKVVMLKSTIVDQFSEVAAANSRALEPKPVHGPTRC